MKNKILWLLVALSLIITAVAMKHLPEKVPMHYNFAGEIDRYGSKYELFIFPGVVLLFAVVWSLLLAHYDKKLAGNGDEKVLQETRVNRKVLFVASLVMMGVFLVLQAVSIYNAMKHTADAAKMSVDVISIEFAAMGLALVIMGNIMPKAKRNGLFGLRTSWSMANDRTWLASNRVGGMLLCVAGVVIVLLAFLLEEMAVIFASLAVVLAVTVIATVYSYVAYKKYGETEK